MQLNEHFEAIADAGHKTAQAGGGITILGWLTSSEGGVAVGIVIGVVGLAIQWYYRRKQDRRAEEQDRREEAEHQLRMRQGGGEL